MSQYDLRVNRSNASVGSRSPWLLVRLEPTFAVFVLFIGTGGLIPLLRLGSGAAIDTSDGDPVTQALWALIYAITVLLIVKGRPSRLVFTALTDPVLVLLVALAAISVTWSFFPDTTMRRSVALIGTTMFGVYFAGTYSRHQQLVLLAWALSIALLLSAAFVFVIPSYGIEVGGDWRGIFINKNVLGRIATVTLAVLLFVSTRGRWLLSLRVALAALTVVLLLGSTSKTALVVSLALLPSIAIARSLRWRLSFCIPFTCMIASVAMAFGLLITGNFAALLSALGKDPTLTGRTQLWAAVIRQIKTHATLGYGFGGFWHGSTGPSAYVWAITGWGPPNAHNGVLDLWLDLGLLGVALFLISYVRTCVHSVILVHRTQSRESVWPFVFLIFMAFYNISESTILRQNSIFWIIYVSIAVSTIQVSIRSGISISHQESSSWERNRTWRSSSAAP